MIDDGRLFIYLAGTRVKADNRAWDLEDGTGEIRAHRHRTETELVVPLAGNGCAGPVELAGSKSGITALVGCDGSVVAPRTRAETFRAPKLSPSHVSGKVEKPVETPEAPKVATEVATENEKIKVLVALSPPATTGARIVALSPARPPEVVPIVASKSVSLPRIESTFPPAPVVPPTLVATGGAAGAGLGAVALPALLLGALAVAAYLFARRRRASVEHHIQIVETASLGPKRSLIIARVGDETLILGTSEAGITLLKASSLSAGFVGASTESVDDSAFEISQPIEEALADIPEPGDDKAVANRGGFRSIEGGLAGLFGARAAYADTRAQNQKGTAEGFGELLEDSVEDQELRQKLAAGLSARVR